MLVQCLSDDVFYVTGPISTAKRRSKQLTGCIFEHCGKTYAKCRPVSYRLFSSTSLVPTGWRLLLLLRRSDCPEAGIPSHGSCRPSIAIAQLNTCFAFAVLYLPVLHVILAWLSTTVEEYRNAYLAGHCRATALWKNTIQLLGIFKVKMRQCI